MPSETRPVIGINLDYIAATKTARPYLRLHPGYVDAVIAAGGMPALMPPLVRESDLIAFVDRVDGFLLTTGLDLDPRRLGQPMHASIHMMAERREDSDRMLVRQILKRQMPVLACGLGMQELNTACGGTLYQHLPEDMPKSLPHFDRSSTEPHRHLVLVQPNTRLDEIYGVGELFVTSNHHQGVRQVGEGFRISAKAPDGVVEAIEATDPTWFAMGVQWHPQAESASALDSQLFECFLQAALQYSAPLSMAA